MAILVGGPGQGDPALEAGDEGGAASSPAPPALKKVTIGGREFEVPEALASAYEAEAQTRQQPDIEAILTRVVQRQAPQPPAEPTARPVPFDPTAFFTNPQPFLDQFRTAIVEEVTKQHIEPLTQKFEAAHNQVQLDRFFSQFYAENKDLTADEGVVRAVLSQNLDKLTQVSGSNPRAARDELAKLTRELLVGVVARHAKPGGTQHRTAVESPAAPRPGAATAEEDTSAKSLSALIRARNERRRKAMTEMH